MGTDLIDAHLEISLTEVADPYGGHSAALDFRRLALGGRAAGGVEGFGYIIPIYPYNMLVSVFFCIIPYDIYPYQPFSSRKVWGFRGFMAFQV